MKKIIFYLFFLFSLPFFTQVKGKVSDTKGNPLSFASIYLGKTVTGTTSNDNGDYILNIKKTGKHTIVFQMLGYKTLKREIYIRKFPYNLDIGLEEESVELSGISISTKDNPANKIIRNVIANKDKNTDKFAQYTADFYSRGLYKTKEVPEKFMGQTLGDFGGGLDSTRSGIVYLSETVSEIKYQKKPKKFKEKIIASKVSGNDNGISFNRAEDANFNFYEDNIEFSNNIISPISSNAFKYYKYKLVGSFYDKNGKLINKIKMNPKRKNDPAFNGYIYIVEDDWTIYGVDVTITGDQLNILGIDILSIKQDYNYSEKNDAWVLISQSLGFKVGFFGFKFDGKFSAAYSNYNFTPTFTDKTFTNEVLTFAKEATKKDSIYWSNLRPVPLTVEEVKDYSIKDSIKSVRKSKKYLDSLDGKRNKFKWLSPITGYTYRNSYEKWRTNFSGLIGALGFNSVQGFNTGFGINYSKRGKQRGESWNIGVEANYGFSDQKLRSTFNFFKKWNDISKSQIRISGGVTTSQFNNRNPVSRLNNTFSSLFNKNNYLKIYEKTFAKIDYFEEIKNGIFFYTSLEYANRKPLFNSINYSFKDNDLKYSSNNPVNNSYFINAPFEAHKVAILNIGANFVFGQKYLSYPNRKVNINNNNYPKLSINYRKVFGANNTELNSDAFLGKIRQNINTGNYGEFSYNLLGGIFLKKKNIAFMDNFQANGNQLAFPIRGTSISNVSRSNLNSFRLLNYYDFYSNDRYGEVHVEHDFKGEILRNIPLINKLNFHIITGGKALITANKKPYTEYSIGLNNIGFGKWRFLRIDYVNSTLGNIKKSGWVFGLTLLN